MPRVPICRYFRHIRVSSTTREGTQAFRVEKLRSEKGRDEEKGNVARVSASVPLRLHELNIRDLSVQKQKPDALEPANGTTTGARDQMVGRAMPSKVVCADARLFRSGSDLIPRNWK
jgi:hypothetical protein